MDRFKTIWKGMSKDTLKVAKRGDAAALVKASDTRNSSLTPTNTTPTVFPQPEDQRASAATAEGTKKGAAPRSVEQYGIFTFKDQPSSSEGKVDIIALHGLNGHYRDTWVSSTGENWLEDAEFLPKHIPNARIMSYGYNSRVEFSKSSAGIGAFAEQLLVQIEGIRRNPEEKKRPIIFVCHSLGGIVVKKVSIFTSNIGHWGCSVSQYSFPICHMLYTRLQKPRC
jgi:hypothetical protein